MLVSSPDEEALEDDFDHEAVLDQRQGDGAEAGADLRGVLSLGIRS